MVAVAPSITFSQDPIHWQGGECLSWKHPGPLSNTPPPTTPDESEVISNASSRINVTDNSALGLPRAVIRIGCSKGTYVRAFARDLGEAFGSGAHLDSLQRSRSGIFRVENALTVDQTMELLSSPQHTTH